MAVNDNLINSFAVMRAVRIDRTLFRRIAVALLLFLPLAAAATPKIEHWTLANGARVYFVETHELPILQMSVVFDAGSARDTPAISGRAMLMSSMLNEGAGKLDVTQIAEAFENIGAEFSADSGRDMSSVSLRTLADRELRDAALGMLATILQAPTFPADSLERERRRALVGLQAIKQSPNALADKRLMELLYREHPYALYPGGSEAGLQALTREDLVDFHREFYVGANAVVALVGDISRGEADAIAKRVVGKLPKGAAPAPLPPVPPLTRAPVEHIKYPSAQSHVLVGAPGMARDDPDYFPLFVGNFAFGGSGLVSRLSTEIRERKGLSYSVYSYFNPLKQRGPFVMGLQTKNAQREEALKLLRATLADFIAKGPTEQELTAAKKNLTGGFPLRIDNNNKIADYLAVIGFYRLPLTYLDDFIGRVEAVTAEQVRAAFARHLDPARMATVTAGGSK